MKSSLRLLPILLLAAATAAGPFAWPATGVSAQGQTTANMLVVTSVMRKCFVETAQLNFGVYDPVQTNATAPLDGQSTITVSCTKGAAVLIGIDNGTHSSGTNRRMSGGTTAFLTYDLYKDDARTQRWGNTGSEVHDAGVAPSRDPRQFIVYGRVPGAQDVSEGAFSDTVLVTVDF